MRRVAAAADLERADLGGLGEEPVEQLRQRPIEKGLGDEGQSRFILVVRLRLCGRHCGSRFSLERSRSFYRFPLRRSSGGLDTPTREALRCDKGSERSKRIEEKMPDRVRIGVI